MLRNVYLYGNLAENFGKEHQFDIKSIPESIRALGSQYPTFTQELRKGEYAIVRGNDLETGMNLSIKEIEMNFGTGDFHIVPVISGSKSAWINIIAGVALIAFAYFVPPAAAAGYSLFGMTITQSSVYMFGAALILSGVSQLLAPVPKAPDMMSREQADERASFIFNGAVNLSEQGGCIPICYGDFFVGSTIISAGIEIEETQV